MSAIKPDKAVKAHDRLCPEPECERSCVDWCDGDDASHYCQCALIAQVRADEREQAAQRVTAAHADRRIRSIERVVAAVRGGAS